MQQRLNSHSIHAVLVAAGPFADEDRLRAQLGQGTILVGIDGGAAYLVRLGLVPDFVLGDFDSLDQDIRDQLKVQGAQIVETPDQDFTDLDKALAYCLDVLSADTISVYGALGGRIDHTYAALSALCKYGRRADICLVDEFGETRFVNAALRIFGPNIIGRVLSLLTLGPVTGITTSGVRWPLTGAALAQGLRDGTSNEIIADTVEIVSETGDLLVFVGHALPSIQNPL